MEIITQVILPFGLAFIMFSMGLTLVVNDFKQIAKQPKAFAVGMFGQMVLLPLIAFAIVSSWSIQPELAVGMMILAVSPGGVTSNLLTHLAKGDTALSISLTATISILSVFTIPFIVNLSLQHFMGAHEEATLPIGKTIFGIFMITTVPVLIGMWMNHFRHGFAVKIEKNIRHIATALFILIFIAAILKERNNIVGYFIEAGPAALTLNLVMMFLGINIAKVFKLPRQQEIAISFECGLQNSALAIMIAATFLQNHTMMIPGAIYGLMMLITGGLFVLWLTIKPINLKTGNR